jgi:2-C-methyl-D-erythritol 2,4-cyclodiphosphate synthase
LKAKGPKRGTGRGFADRRRTVTIQVSPLRLRPWLRIGFGSDVHPLARGRKLTLGGVRIPFDKGPVSHSDGDALAHAVCDALLGAAALGDIGQHFPDSSPRWHNISSLVFLRETRRLLAEAGYRILNVDATVELERPKLAPHIPSLRKKIAAALGLTPAQVSVKAKTEKASMPSAAAKLSAPKP